ncbi:hypothetical protein DAPPUDRAFT_236969 [Daphnia pulex]|uniref:Uncharacterized protein n=1 Tax=Daphnia pulex TaxID=6669 RepID=E9G2E1_DAPPU|nr:hypothetical protein DAPPUDRAFT_236969 [Daphnia pulex]|eukprot:EFX86236.1 hypothetical protein DAPPUDRAFT_236969 [Daphnia pulex]
MAGSTTHVPISSENVAKPRCRRPTTQRSQHTQHLLTTPRPSSTTPARLKSFATDYAALIYIIKAPEYYTTEAPNYTTEYTAPAYYTEAHKYYSAPSYTITTEAAKYYVAQTYNTAADPSEINKNKHYTEALKYNSAPTSYTETPKYYSVPIYYTDAPTYYATKAVKYYTGSTTLPRITTQRLFRRTTLSRNTALRLQFTTLQPKLHRSTTPPRHRSTTPFPACYATKAVKCYNEAPKYYSAPNYYIAAAPSYYSKYYTEVPVYYTTTHAALSYHTDAPKYYDTKTPEFVGH